jgi:hypothetical protein
LNIRDGLTRSLLLAPGVVDASLASLAGFLTTIYAAHYLEPAELGVFGLYFSGFLLTNLIPTQLYFVPVERASLESPAHERIGLTAPTSRTGLLFCGGAALLAPLPGLIALGEVSTAAILALGLSNAALVFASPLQDHVRLMHHFSERPSGAVMMSATQVTVVIIAMVGLHVADVPATWIPFGALAIANLCSISQGLFLARSRAHPQVPELPSFGVLIRLGGVLLAAEGLLAGAALASESLVLLLSSPEALGFAAAAGAVARPVAVFSIGIGRVLAPRMMSAGLNRQKGSAVRLSLAYAGSLILFVSVYLAAVGWSYDLNPMLRLIPAAYEKPGLVVALAIGLTVHRCAAAPLWILLGAQRSKTILWIAGVTSATRLAGVAVLAPAIGAFAVAAGFLIEGAVRGVGGIKATTRMFDEEET